MIACTGTIDLVAYVIISVSILNIVNVRVRSCYVKTSHGNKIIIVRYTKSHFLKTPSAFASIATILSTYNIILLTFLIDVLCFVLH